MESKVIYVPVSTAMDYPPVGHEVTWISVNGNIYKGKLEKWEDNHSWVNCSTGERLSVFDFSEWYREVLLPSEEDIFKDSIQYSESFGLQVAYKDGANYIISIINPHKTV